MKGIGERIKAIRAGSGKTQDEFAKSLELSRNYIWQIEAGQKEPSGRVLSGICAVYGVNRMWLETGIGEMHAEQSTAAEMAAMFGALTAVPESVQSQLVTVFTRAVREMPEEALVAFLKKIRDGLNDMKID